MSQTNEQVCPWCQTEIVWDPEIGPEESCPHCFNELGDYRSIKLDLGQDRRDSVEDEDEDQDPDEEDLGDFEDDYGDFDGMDDYEEGVQRVLDTQEDTPECPSCHSFMLLAGTGTMSDYTPAIPQSLNQPLLKPKFGTRVFVCPSCFKVEHVLSEADRMTMVELLKEHGSK